MPKTVIISDTTCLILLEKIGCLDILKGLFGQIIITSIVADEFGGITPDWILIEDPSVHSQFKSLKIIVDDGEASSIALALEKPNSMVIIDDLAGRKLASYLDLELTGTLGILKMAKVNKVIEDLQPIVEAIRKTNFRISERLLKALLAE